MGGFAGFGKSSADKALDFQRQQAQDEAARSLKDSQLRQAERTANKGNETANIKLGGSLDEVATKDSESAIRKSVSSSLGLGTFKKGKKNTGVQL